MKTFYDIDLLDAELILSIAEKKEITTSRIAIIMSLSQEGCRNRVTSSYTDSKEYSVGFQSRD